MSRDLDGSACSEEAARLLPWYLTGRLSAPDRERVEHHLERCAVCRDDVEHETSVRALLRADTSVEFAPQAGLAKTLARIDELGRDAQSGPPPRPEAVRRRTAPLRWLTAAVVVQAVALGGLGVALYHASSGNPASAPYQTLSSGRSPPTGPRIRAVFVPTMTLGDLQVLLRRGHLAVIDGPSDAGVYTLAMPGGADAGSLDTVVRRLRSTSGILFAEPAVNDTAAPR